MRILFTGASSFTGFWFVQRLLADGHEVVATFTRATTQFYDGLRRARLDRLLAGGRMQAVFDVRFGSPEFIALIQAMPAFDLLCHHGAEVQNFKSPDFDVHGALAANTKNLPAVLDALRARGVRHLLLTGTYFEPLHEPGENGGAVSPYGLSKGLTTQMFKYWCSTRGVKLARFTLPNPIGPLEEPRFVSYLVNAWLDDKVPVISTPDYVRDNAPIDALAQCYSEFATFFLSARDPMVEIDPSGWVETNLEFAHRVARECGARLDVPCSLNHVVQTEFDQPRVRRNRTPILGGRPAATEAEFWDGYVGFYLDGRKAK